MERLDIERLYNGENESVFLVTLEGAGKTAVNLLEDHGYEVISGTGNFSLVNEGICVQAQSGSSFMVEAGVRYGFEGDFVMLCTTTPTKVDRSA